MISTEDPITGIILAGGKSSRMGSEKGLLTHQGKTFVEHIAEAMKPLVEDILIITSNSEYTKLGLNCVQDIYPDSGPLGGVYTGLFHSQTNRNLVLSCDIPLITTEHLKALTHLSPSEEIDVIQLGRDKHKTKMPLVAIYHRSCLPTFKDLLEKKELKLQYALQQVNTLTLYKTTEFWKDVEDINTPEQLSQLQQRT